ncbi:MAG: vanadium-dependent haloperoxidase [Saprospiraceae bacterium]|uniref:Vanadium-dependent haloperoxidase n=1 Tax=Candidatus Opimibacter skivensis TaxID=2982028 RepID=A0A9D7SYQ8_9BACT|nr:vanadium-dependent haloperoxidase [Candidatus Opimibacter skivensis]
MVVSVTVIVVLYLLGCLRSFSNRQNDEVSIALEWNQFILKAEITTEGFRAPVAARAYGYIGLAAYEAALPGLNGNFQSIVKLFPGIKLPSPPARDHFNVAASLNACYAAIIGKFFMSSADPVSKHRLEIIDRWEKKIENETDTMSLRISKDFGSGVAEAVYQWSSTDTLGFEANHHNYMRDYTPPVGEGLWVTSPYFPMPALLPYWGKVRPFIINTEQYKAKPLPEFTAAPNQIYYTQALEILSLSKPLSAENQWIAEFWNDDHPDLTFTPAGHWLAITNEVIEKERPSIEKTLETYLKMGFALTDATIACWASKYYYNQERPETFIQNYLDKDWRPFSPSPSFPSYPSGHSMMGAAASVVLTKLYGDHYAMTDRSHDDLKGIVVKPRQFHSFDEMAKESALSRMLVGVHFRFDCEEGLRLGDLIGRRYRNWSWRKN